MMAENVDVLILGSGFGGSLLSMLLARSGLTVAVVDQNQHPRFAIGESSTPLADTMLARLANEYDLPELLPLTKYGPWKRTYPEITCGLKRGFSYFGHLPDVARSAEQPMLVAASRSNEASDTHWLRSDVDSFLFRCATDRGVQQFENAEYELTSTSDGWHLDGTSNACKFSLSSPFIIDATGAAGRVLRHLQIPSQTDRLSTFSHSVFAHFKRVRTVESMLNASGVSCNKHPFTCDAAAVHHVLDNGWMWQLRFDDDTVSAGFLFNQRHRSSNLTREATWRRQLERFPFLKTQFAGATIVRPDGGLQATGRIQRLTTSAAGRNWAALPNTAGFIDPLHSTGIAHTLFGVHRLAKIMTVGSKTIRTELLSEYSSRVLDELLLVDELVAGCYESLPSYRLWCDWCMLYFTAVTSMEQTDDAPGSFLRADDISFRSMLSEARKQLQVTVNSSITDPAATESACNRFETWLADAIRPWNFVGLFDPASDGMYSHTAAP